MALGTGTPPGEAWRGQEQRARVGMCNPAGWWGAGSSPRHPPCIEGCSTADSVPHPPSQGLGTPVTPLPRSLPEAEGSVENDSFEVAESQAIMSRLQWDGSSDISPSDSASSKASECWGWGGVRANPPAQTPLQGKNWVFLVSPQHKRGQTDRRWLPKATSKSPSSICWDILSHTCLGWGECFGVHFPVYGLVMEGSSVFWSSVFPASPAVP